MEKIIKSFGVFGTQIGVNMYAKIQITGIIEIVTGMHIGGSAAFGNRCGRCAYYKGC